MLEIFSIVTSLLTLVIGGITVLRRLALIQKRLNSLKGLLVLAQGRVTDIEKYLISNNGYHIREIHSEIEEAFSEQYEDNDTGF